MLLFHIYVLIKCYQECIFWGDCMSDRQTKINSIWTDVWTTYGQTDRQTDRPTKVNCVFKLMLKCTKQKNWRSNSTVLLKILLLKLKFKNNGTRDRENPRNKKATALWKFLHLFFLHCWCSRSLQNTHIPNMLSQSYGNACVETTCFSYVLYLPYNVASSWPPSWYVMVCRCLEQEWNDFEDDASFLDCSSCRTLQ